MNGSAGAYTDDMKTRLGSVAGWVAGVALVSVALAGCAADTADGSSDGVSQDELSGRSTSFVGTYRWKSPESLAGAREFDTLSLKADGTYSALLAPSSCTTAPCPEAGTWTVVKWTNNTGAGRLDIQPSTSTMPTRSYYASRTVSTYPTSYVRLSLLRNSYETLLFSGSPPPAPPPAPPPTVVAPPPAASFPPPFTQCPEYIQQACNQLSRGGVYRFTCCYSQGWYCGLGDGNGRAPGPGCNL